VTTPKQALMQGDECESIPYASAPQIQLDTPSSYMLSSTIETNASGNRISDLQLQSLIGCFRMSAHYLQNQTKLG